MPLLWRGMLVLLSLPLPPWPGPPSWWLAGALPLPSPLTLETSRAGLLRKPLHQLVVLSALSTLLLSSGFALLVAPRPYLSSCNRPLALLSLRSWRSFSNLFRVGVPRRCINEMVVPLSWDDCPKHFLPPNDSSRPR